MRRLRALPLGTRGSVDSADEEKPEGVMNNDQEKELLDSVAAAVKRALHNLLGNDNIESWKATLIRGDMKVHVKLEVEPQDISMVNGQFLPQ